MPFGPVGRLSGSSAVVRNEADTSQSSQCKTKVIWNQVTLFSFRRERFQGAVQGQLFP